MRIDDEMEGREGQMREGDESKGEEKGALLSLNNGSKTLLVFYNVDFL